MSKELEREAIRRLDQAKAQKRKVERDLFEAYFFAAPNRWREMDGSRSARNASTLDQNAELMTVLGIEAATDFATHVQNTYMPPNFPWIRRGPGVYTPKDTWDRVKDDVEAADDQILSAIRASNFDAVSHQAMNPDLGVGTLAMWVDDPIPAAAPIMHPVPVRELEIDIGPFGWIDARFWVRRRGRDYLKTIVGAARYDKIPEKIKKMPVGKSNRPEEVEIVVGFWRIWDDPARVRWQEVWLVDKTLIDSLDYEGEGACPLIPGRWSPDPALAFGFGPTIQTLGLLRVLDEMTLATYDRADFANRPPMSYPSDGVTNFENGIEAGKLYPVAPGNAQDFKPLIDLSAEPNLGIYTLQDLEKSIKRLHFIDMPEQAGKTPPTASQWLDQMMESQRRIGSVGQLFWHEFAAQIFQRFAYLLERKNLIPQISKDSRAVGLQAVNPAVKSQEAQEVQTAMRLMQFSQFWPMESQVAIDGLASLQLIKKKMGDKLIQFRPDAQVKGLVQSGLQAIAAQAQAQQQQPQQGKPNGAAQIQ